MPGDGDVGVPLAAAIGELRDQLMTAMLDGETSPLRFSVVELELSLEIAVTKSAEGHAGIKFWLVDVGGKGAYANAATHRITMKLDPIGVDGGPVKLGDDAPGRPG